MFDPNDQNKYAKRLFGLMLAVVGSMNLLVLPGYSTRAAMSAAATKTSGSQPTAPSLYSSSGESTRALITKANGKIAFARHDRNGYGIYVMNADGSNQTRLIDGEALDRHPIILSPAWSPDGTKIAFTASSNSSYGYIYVMNADGSNPTRLSENQFDNRPAWSPDGTRIAFDSTRNGSWEIWIMNADGSNQIQLTSSPFNGFNPAWSPDGTKIAFASDTRIYVMNADGSNRTTLIDGEGWFLDSPTWSPDGTKIALTFADSFSSQIVVMNADGSDRKPFDGYDDYGPVWSPDGTKIAFTRLLDDSFRSADIYVINADGSNPINLTSHPDSGSPAWQPLPTVSNPIDDAQFFVRQHYLDFLNREPEQRGLDDWMNFLNSCPAGDLVCLHEHRLTASADFFGSPEFKLKGYFVFRFYRVAFDRLPTYDEIAPDMQGVTGDTPGEVYQKKADFTNSFVQRPEFVNSFGALSNADYVAALLNHYQLTSITTPDPGNPDGTNKVTLSQADFVSRLDATTLTRAQVLRAIADSDEVLAAEINRAFVAMQYYGYLRRTPEPKGYNDWLNYLNAHPTDFREMVRGFMDSIEYRMRFGRP